MGTTGENPYVSRCVYEAREYSGNTDVECEDVVSMLEPTDAQNRQRMCQCNNSSDEEEDDFDNMEWECLLVRHE